MAIRMKARIGVNKALLDAPQHALDAVQVGLRDGAHAWKDGIFPGHFETGAPGKYDYTPRTRRYMIRKARIKGHQKPMVWSGRMRDELVRSQPLLTSRTSGRHKASVTLTLYGHARALNLWKGGSRAHDFGRELSAVTAAELETLEIVSQESAAAEVSRRMERSPLIQTEV